MKALVCSFFLCVLALTAQAQKVRSDLSADRVFVGQTVYLQVTVDPAEGAKMVTPPAAEGLKVLLHQERRGSTSSRVTIVNGRMTREDSSEALFIFAVTAEKAGVYELSSPVVEANGKTVAAERVRIVVEAENAQDLAIVVSTVDKPIWYRGESIGLTVEVFLKHLPAGLETRDPLGMHDRPRGLLDGGTPPPTLALPWIPSPPAGLGDFPAIDWLNAQRMGQQGGGLCLPGENLARVRVTGAMSDVQRRDQSGQATGYRLYRFSVNLLAESVGKYDLGTPTLVGKLVERRGREFVWRDIFARGAPLAFEVTEPPLAGRPPSFTGAVGDFQIELAPPTPAEVRVGDPIYLTLVLSGDGYLKGTSIDFEKALGPRFRVDPPTVLDSLPTQDKPPAGFPTRPGKWRQFEVKVRPLDSSVTEIPALEIATFDPKSGQYKVLTTTPAAIVVQALGNSSSGVVVGNRSASGAAASELVAVALAPNIDDLNRARKAPLDPKLPLALFCLAPFSAWVATRLRRRRDALANDPSLRRRLGAKKRARTRLSEARTALATDSRAGLLAAADAFRGFLADRWDLSEDALTADEVQRRLQGETLAASAVSALHQILAHAEAVRFGGSVPDRAQVHRLLESAEGALAEVRKPATLGFLLGLALLAPQRDSEFLQRAQAAYQAGDYAAAAEGFQRSLDERGENGPVLFNLGNCYCREGRLGLAIAAYRRAQRYLPTDENVRNNLEQTLRRRTQDFSLRRDRAWYDFAWFWRPTSSFEIQAWTAVVLAWLASAAAYFAGRSEGRASSLRGASWLLAVLAVAVGSGAAFTAAELSGRPLGVVVQDGVRLLQWPEAGAPAGYDQAVDQGGEFRVLSARPDWIQIRLADRYEGWIPALAARRY